VAAGRERGLSPLLCLCEAPSAALHPDLGHPVQEGCEAVETGPKQGNEDAQRAGALSL